MPGKTISSAVASDMARLYEEHVRTLPVHAVKKTQYVSFTLSTLMEYLRQAAPIADELRVYLGVHPEDHKEHPGRVTTIFWPYKDDKPAIGAYTEGKDGGDGGQGFPPYNDGSNTP